MKHRAIYLVILISGLMLGGCGKAELAATSEPTATNAPAAAATAAPTVTVEATQAAATPTGLPSPTEEPAAEIPTASPTLITDEGGVVNITGLVTYTHPFFTLGVAAPVVILEDQAGFVDRNEEFLMPVESQTLGQITSDFFTSPFSYSISLPIEPQGSFRDVDHDSDSDLGVQIYAVAYWTNTFGDPFLEERDLFGGGWSTAYASTRISEEAELEREIVGGKFLVYAPDEQQGFPEGFGEDRLLFTDDDPIVLLPQGYTVVDMDVEPFAFDRSRHQHIDLVEPEGASLDDYSQQSYTEAFDSLVEQMRLEYAFTEYKGVDWDQLYETFLPRFQEADQKSDSTLYRRALRDFSWMIPDGHVSGPFITEDFWAAAGDGIGAAIGELEDGRAVVSFLLAGGPADQAGIEFGAEIQTIDGIGITQYISDTVSYFGPYSTLHHKRQDQLLFAMRFPSGDELEIQYLNPGSTVPETVKITAVPEVDSLNFWFKDSDRDGFELPVEYELMDNGFGYVQIFSFSDNAVLTIQLWERMLQAMNDKDVPALIVDMRQNGGGRGFLADQMAAYFFDEPLVLGNSGGYDEDRGEFYFNPDYEDHFYLPAEDLRYHGDLVVLVGYECASACEFFSYDLTLEERATVIGHTPTAGMGGAVDEVAMPEDEQFRFTIGRAVDPDGNIHIEGIGVVPDIDVPVSLASLTGQSDAVLDTAVRFLSGDTLEATDIEISEPAEGALAPDTTVHYRLRLSAGDVVDISLTASAEASVSFFDENGELLGVREGREIILPGLEAPYDLVLILEIAAASGSGLKQYTLEITPAAE